MHKSDSRKIQKQIIRAVVKRKAASDIATLPIKLVPCELLSIEDECLQENDLKSLTKAASKRNTFLHANVRFWRANVMVMRANVMHRTIFRLKLFLQVIKNFQVIQYIAE